MDRDGVINKRIVGGYVTRLDEFILEDGVLDAMVIFSRHFDHIFVVTNQQGIGKGLMTEADLAEIHGWFLQQVNAAGGRLDNIYHCPSLKNDHSFMRKPSIGMALKAKKDYPDVALHRSVMVGDTRSDMLFGRRAGMRTVLVGEEPEVARENHWLVDLYFDDLISFANYLDTHEEIFFPTK